MSSTPATAGRSARHLRAAVPPLEKRLARLRFWNLGVGAVLAVEAVVIALLTNGFSLPVTATFPIEAPGTPPRTAHLFNLPLGWGVFAFVAISAAALFIIASPRVFEWYKANLLQDRNYGRWIEYFFSSSIMMVLIAMLTGISDSGALIAIFGVNASMILFGLLMEKYETPGRPSWLSFLFGCFAGAVPWVIVAISVLGIGFNRPAPPTFVYGIVISLFVFFNIFAVNMWLQYHKVGRWRDYLFGEKVYIVLSLTAKSLLAWWVFSAVLIK